MSHLEDRELVNGGHHLHVLTPTQHCNTQKRGVHHYTGDSSRASSVMHVK
jgi:hypothetical protein